MHHFVVAFVYHKVTISTGCQAVNFVVADVIAHIDNANSQLLNVGANKVQEMLSRRMTVLASQSSTKNVFVLKREEF